MTGETLRADIRSRHSDLHLENEIMEAPGNPQCLEDNFLEQGLMDPKGASCKLALIEQGFRIRIEMARLVAQLTSIDAIRDSLESHADGP